MLRLGEQAGPQEIVGLELHGLQDGELRIGPSGA
jgi:hypothetical protein